MKYTSTPNQLQHLLGASKSSIKWKVLLCVLMFIVVFLLMLYVLSYRPTSSHSGFIRAIIATVEKPDYVVVDSRRVCTNPSLLLENVIRDRSVSIPERMSLLEPLTSMRETRRISPFNNIAMHVGSSGNGFDSDELAKQACESLPVSSSLATRQQVEEAVRNSDVQWWEFGWIANGDIVAPLHPNHLAISSRALPTGPLQVDTNPEDGKFYPAYCHIDLPLPDAALNT